MYQPHRARLLRELAGRGELAFERILRATDDLLARGLTRHPREPS